MKIRKPFVTWEEFIEGAIGGAGTPAAHTHVKADITDTPWAWADVSKVGSNLTDLATWEHAAEHEVGGGDLIAFADITDFGDWIDQAVKEASNVQFANIVATGNITAATNFVSSTQRIILHATPTADTAYFDFNINDNAIVIPETSGYFHIVEYGTWNTLFHVRADGKVSMGTDDPGEFDFRLYKDIPGENVVLKIENADDTPDSATAYACMTTTANGVSAQICAYGANYNVDIFAGFGKIAGYVNGLIVGAYDGGIIKFIDATTPTEWARFDNAGQFGIGKIPTEKLDVDGTVKATLFEGNLHWDYITNEPTFYPPEYHYHVGKDIVSLHLVDLDDVEADDIFDVLPTAAIHGEGNYDWWGTWETDAGAGCSAEIVVLAGDDKYLRLTDGNAGTRVQVQLSTAADHPMVIACIQFRVRQSSNAKEGHIYFIGGANSTYIQMADDGDMKFWDGAALTVLQAYAANTWYTIRIYWDCVSAAVAVWVENVFKIRKDLAALEYVEKIRLRTKIGDTGYTLDINALKVFNLTV